MALEKNFKDIDRRLQEPLLPSLEEERNWQFYDVPTSPTTNLMLDTLGAGADINTLPARKRVISHAATYNVTSRGSERKVELSTKDSTITLTLSDIDKLSGSNKTAKKLLVFTLSKMSHNALSNGVLYTDILDFPLRELVDNGLYKNLDTARIGFKSGMDTLTSIKVGGSIKRGKRELASGVFVLFPAATLEKGQCRVRLSKDINWSFIAQYFTKLPSYAFALPNKAFDLLYYIFYLARQNTREIKESGFFKISFRALQQRLMLPNEVGAKNPQRDIKDPIENAIVEIENHHREAFHNLDFQLLPVYDDNLPIGDWLDSGYIKVTLKGSFSEPFIELEDTRTKKVETAVKRREAIVDEARTRNMAEALKAEEAAQE